MKPPLPPREAERLQALRSYRILDMPPEQSLDDITVLAAHVCEAPTALISFIDSDRQWFKSRFGWSDPESSREISFCAHAIVAADGGELIVPDATRDPRFSSNPYVTATPILVRFYAGVPLVTSDGHALGTLCVIDTVARNLKPEQLSALRALRRSIVNELEVRRSRAELTLLAQALGRVHPEDRVRLQEALQDAAAGRAVELHCRLAKPDGGWMPVRQRIEPLA